MNSANARELTRQAVQIADGQLRIERHAWTLESLERICIVGGGKATAAMTRGCLDALCPNGSAVLPVCGQINVPQAPTTYDFAEIKVCMVRRRGENLPTIAASNATRQMLTMLSELGPNDLCGAG